MRDIKRVHGLFLDEFFEDVLGHLEILGTMRDIETVCGAPIAAVRGGEFIPVALDAPDQVRIPGSPPWRGQVDGFEKFPLGVPVLDHVAADNRLRKVADHLLDERGHLLKIRKRPVGLEHRELRIVPARNSLVAEIPVQLENFRETADEKPLEIKLGRDAQKQVHSQRIVAGLERLGGGPARDLLHHRGFDLDKSALFKKPPDFAHDRDAFQKHIAGFRICDQVEIPLPVFDLGVLDPVPLVGERTEGF